MIHKNPVLLLLIAFCLTCSVTKGQYMTTYDYGHEYETIRDIKQTMDGGYIMIGDLWNILNPLFNKKYIYITKTNQLGELEWTRVYQGGIFTAGFYIGTNVFQMSDGGYMLFGIGMSYPVPQTATGGMVSIRTDAQGTVLWKKDLIMNADVNLISDFVQTADGGYAGYFRTRDPSIGTYYGTIARLDSLTDTVWTRSWTLDIGGAGIKTLVQTADEGFTICASNPDTASNGANIWRTLLTHVDSAGNLVWSQLHDLGDEFLDPDDMLLLSNGNYAVVGMERDSAAFAPYSLYPSLCIYDPQGNRLSSHRYGGGVDPSKGRFHRIIQTADNHLVMVGTAHTSPDSMYLAKVDSLGALIWDRMVDVHEYANLQVTARGFCQSNGGGYAIGVTNFDSNLPRLLLVDSLGILQTNIIEGYVFQDSLNDCQRDGAELVFDQMLIRVEEMNTGVETFALTDSTGHYQMHLLGGAYLAEIVSTPSYHGWTCLPPDTLHVDTYDQDTIDFPLEIIQACPYNTVEMSIPFIPFNTTTQIHVEACNSGSVASFNTSVEVLIDSALSFVSAVPPPSQMIGQLLIFDLDTLNRGECMDINILAQLDTLTLFGATHCATAKIYPDTICYEPSWPGADLKVTSACQNDSVLFTISNEGADMIESRLTMVYIDDVIFRQVSFQLDSNESITIIEPADSGATYLAEVQQEVDYPSYLGDSVAIAFYEGCLPYADGTFNTGFIIPFYLGNAAPSEAIVCRENVAAYDPNDKLAQPVGYGPDHLIYPQTPIDYTIRFQNTGNDTARRVIILDTLSDYLDLRTLEFGASSHPYRASIIGHNTLRFTFQPIILPDSNVNEPASHGAVSFRIQPKADVPIGTVIPNRAGIYFDYAAPVMTPEIFHTIGIDFIPMNLVSIEQEVLDDLSLKVWPNPFQQQISFQVSNQNYNVLEVEVMDMQGRVVGRKQVQHSDRLDLQANGWVEGIYVYQLFGNGQPIARGKVVLSR